ncbi:hypothetical protein FB451DRAFT_1272720 [Mycena latifolia]|nr:hypothetical protein FB451DRAFT_1272720 [Mycena latifolia]
MYFTRLAQTLGFALFALLPAGHAQSTSLDPIIIDDITCPTDAKITFIHNSYTYNAPMKNFTDVMGSFYGIKWTGGVLPNNTTGQDNVVGASRSSNYFGGVFNETLTMILERPDAYSYTYHGVPFPVAFPNQPVVQFYNYAETLRVLSICSGKATYIDFVTYLCTDNPIHAYNLLETELHQAAVQAVAQTANATIMPGDCERLSY